MKKQNKIQPALQRQEQIIFQLISLSVACMISWSFVPVIQAAELTQVSVQPNPYNTLAEQLASKEASLNDRATALSDLQKRLDQGYSQVFWLLAGLFALIVINFILDIRRRKIQSVTEASMDGTISHKNIEPIKV